MKFMTRAAASASPRRAVRSSAVRADAMFEVPLALAGSRAANAARSSRPPGNDVHNGAAAVGSR